MIFLIIYALACIYLIYLTTVIIAGSIIDMEKDNISLQKEYEELYGESFKPKKMKISDWFF
jgi:hypothetical protein